VTSLQSLKTRGSFSYCTFASGGYIIRMSPIAIGTDVVPTCVASVNALTPAGHRYPTATPTAIAVKIQSVR
jgi:hypothetical protein